MQNGQLEGIIDYNMSNIGKTMPASKTISIEQIKDWRTCDHVIYCNIHGKLCQIDYCKTECESSGKDAPCKLCTTRAGWGDYSGRLASCL